MVLINILIQFAIYELSLDKEWFLLFNMDKEVNFPTLYTCILLLLCAGLITLIIKNKDHSGNQLDNKWKALRWIFCFLALDEALQIHEIFIISNLKDYVPALLTNIWIIPYGLFAIYAFFYFIKLVLRLPKKIRNLVLASGFIYVLGALGMEIIGSYLVRVETIRLHGVSYGLICTVEETLEICGLIIFIHALMLYIFNYQEQIFKINFRIGPSKSKANQIDFNP